MTSLLKSGTIALALGCAAVAPAAAQSVGPAVGNPIKKAVALANGGNTAAAIQQVNAARAAAKNPTERTKVSQTAAYVYTRGGQWLAAARELEQVGAGPRQLAPYYYRAGQYQKAIELAKRAGGQDMEVVMAQSYLKLNNPQAAADVYKRLIKSNPRPEWLGNLASIQYKTDRVGYLQTIRQLIKADPSPNNWKILLIGLKQQNMGTGAKFAVYELLRQTGNLTTSEDVQDFTKFAVLSGVPGAGARAIDEAAGANVVNKGDPMIARLVQVSEAKAREAQAAVGKGPIQAANAAYGAGNFPQAAELYGRIAGANGPDTDQARVLGGIALIRAGNAAAALRMLNAVSDKSAFKDVAELWALYAQTRRA
ncbi:MAG: tetratricopeptide repeat protein [Sphingomonadaceae bacterium]|nr:tetratricopeptide repeat protein [Sphingomonadaceae bacterium]